MLKVVTMSSSSATSSATNALAALSPHMVKELLQSKDLTHLKETAVNLGACQVAVGQEDQLCKLQILLWNRILQLQKADASVASADVAATYRIIGSLWIKMGETDKAIGQLNKALETESESAATELLFARAYFNAAEYSDAILHQEQAISLFEAETNCDVTRMMAAYVTLSTIYEAKADFTQAVELLQKAQKWVEMKLAENSSEDDTKQEEQQHKAAAIEVYSRLGTLLDKIGEYSSAMTVLQKAHTLLVQTKGENDPRTQEIAYLLEMASNLAGDE